MTKKLLILLIAVFTLGTFSSCEGPMGPAGRNGLDGLDGLDGNGSIILTPLFKVESRDWNWDDQAGVYFYKIPVKELTAKLALDGEVFVSIAGDNGVYYPLYETTHHYDNGYFTETIGFNYEPGYVTITIGASDLFDGVDPDINPASYTSKITLLYY